MKFSKRGRAAIFLGYAQNRRVYTVFFPDAQIVRDVHTLKLDEQQLLNANVNSSDLTRVLPVYEKLFQKADDRRKEVSAPVSPESRTRFLRPTMR